MAFADFENLLKDAIGLDTASVGASAIERAVMERTLACDLRHPHDYWQHVSASPAELQTLIEAVVVPESWFFRDRDAFTTLIRLVREQSVLPHADGVLRVLSLPSSTGEEPYSIAMALFDAGIPAHRFSIDAADISARAIAAARKATYGNNSFRGRDLGFRPRHFDAVSMGYRLRDRVRRQVHFRHANLFAAGTSSGPAAYQVIFCRNLLIYFDRETQTRAIGILERQLAPGGVLFVAPSETSLLLNHRFVRIKAPFAFAFRKGEEGTSEQKAPIGGASRSRVASLPPAGARANGSLNLASIAAPAPPSQTQARAEDDATLTLKEAGALANGGRFAEAFERCEQHLRHAGPSAAVFQLMGLVRDASGDTVEAEKYYRKALYLEPNQRDVLVHLALLLEKAGRTTEAQVLRNRTNRLHQNHGPDDAPTR